MQISSSITPQIYLSSKSEKGSDLFIMEHIKVQAMLHVLASSFLTDKERRICSILNHFFKYIPLPHKRRFIYFHDLHRASASMFAKEYGDKIDKLIIYNKIFKYRNKLFNSIINADQLSTILTFLSDNDLLKSSSPNKKWHTHFIYEMNRRLSTGKIEYNIGSIEKASKLKQAFSAFSVLPRIILSPQMIDVLDYVKNNFKDIRRLEYSEIFDSHVHMTLGCFTNLTELILNVRYCTVSLNELSSLIHLNSLDAGCLKLNTDKDFALLSYLTNLASLKLDRSNIGDIGLKSIASLTKLGFLNLNNCENITEEGFSNFNRLLNLKSLYLSSNFINDTVLKLMSSFTNLTTLDLYSNPITDIGLNTLLNFTNLTYLNLGLTQITPEGKSILIEKAKIKTLVYHTSFYY